MNLAVDVCKYMCCVEKWVLFSSALLRDSIYRMAGNFRGIQFSRKAHLQRFRDLIFADGRSRVAPPTISVRLHLLLNARRGSNLQPKKTARDRSIVLVLSRDREMARE